MLKIVDHALVQENLTKIRDKNIDRVHFRSGIIEIGRLFAYEFTNTLDKKSVSVQTPLGIAEGIKIKDMENIVVVSVLRAAIPLVEGISKVFKDAEYGVIGAWRSEEPPFKAKMEYIKLPDLENKIVIVADPMLATGGTMNSILDEIKRRDNPKRLVVFNIISAEPGIEKIFENHPEVEIYTCSVDEKLNKEGYIIPGLGDVGDICFGRPCL
ncbi:uracil phosphoribosyltransferase [Methanobacterium oryzae]|uniref:uracil phosphoribosyltransferase n=1 Tax=Methanobacterium oryzae TaxID=69540 RepID=UPI003D1F0318